MPVVTLRAQSYIRRGQGANQPWLPWEKGQPAIAVWLGPILVVTDYCPMGWLDLRPQILKLQRGLCRVSPPEDTRRGVACSSPQDPPSTRGIYTEVRRH